MIFVRTQASQVTPVCTFRIHALHIYAEMHGAFAGRFIAKLIVLRHFLNLGSQLQRSGSDLVPAPEGGVADRWWHRTVRLGGSARAKGTVPRRCGLSIDIKSWSVSC
jgi:hypothetical protein